MKFKNGKIHYQDAMEALGLRRKEDLAPIIGANKSWITANITKVRPYLSRAETKCVLYSIKIEELEKCLSQK